MKLSKASKTGHQNVLYYPNHGKRSWLTRIVRNKKIVLNVYFPTREEAIQHRDEFLVGFGFPGLVGSVNPAPGTDDRTPTNIC